MELFKHQIEGIQFLKENKKVILADEMGLGKTIQAIIAAKETRELYSMVLVVCPASLKINWKREIERQYPGESVSIAGSRGLPEGMDMVGDWIIINYDILEKRLEQIEAMVDSGTIKTLILDEAHYIKGKSVRAACVVGGKVKKKNGKVAFAGIAAKMERVYCLTGTPLLNRPIEMFNLLKAIGHKLGMNRSFYAKRYCGAYLKTVMRRYAPPIRFMDESGASHLDELQNIIGKSMIRRTKDQELDLPEKIVSAMDVEINGWWRMSYDMAWDNYLEFLRENPDPTKNIESIIMARQLVEIQKLKQVCSQAKVGRICEDIKNAVEQDAKIIIFSQYTKTIEMLAEHLDGEKIGYVTLTGEKDSEERQKAVDDFQNDKAVKVFIANIKAGGVGITLTEASIVMFADMDWSPEIHNQAIDRAHRIGQNKMVNAYFYVATGTIEDDIMELLKAKEGVIKSVLEGGDVETTSMFKQLVAKLARKTAG
jgi:SWI/SNF-related matrix-associated actin-dependent regulator 1 of chromatin subfamily A